MRQWAFQSQKFVKGLFRIIQQLINKMIAPESDNLRSCERIKRTQVYWHVESLAKKIRHFKPELMDSQTIINANAEQREIDVFYKVGWEYEHAHSNMTCDISEPLFVQPSFSPLPHLQDYYTRISNLIFRFKTEHEDDTICRVTIKPYLSIQEMTQKQSYNLICSKGIYKSSINAMESVTRSMHENMVQLEDSGINQNIAGKYWQVKYAFDAIISWLEKYNSEINNFPNPESVAPQNVPVTKEILQFMGNFVETVTIMRNEKKSALFNAQPNIEMLTHLVHPALMGIYTVYRKEKILWENQYEHNINNIVFEERVQKDNCLPQDIQHFQIPKAVFINLDGYESEYNIEFARNMDKHLMYITFPKFENHAEEEDLSVNNRFFKKFFFNYTRDMYEYDRENCDYLGDDEAMHQHRNFEGMGMGMEEDYDAANVEEEFHIRYNPEEYYACIDRMLRSKDKPKNDKNIYILPISFRYLFKEMILKSENDAKKYSSYFIWSLMRDFVGEDIKKFNPNYIVVSYSGRINIIDAHFTQIMQQLCQSCGRKVLLYPNFTSQLSQEIALDEVYDNFPPSQTNIIKTSTDFYRKISQFLKISSGTYNLQSSYEKMPILSRYKIGKVNKYTLDLLEGLSKNQYEHLSGRVPDIIMKSTDIILTKGIAHSEKQIENSVPRFYKQMIIKIQALLLSKEQQKWLQNREIHELLDSIRNNLQEIATSEGKNSIEYLVNEIVQNYKLQICSQKITEEAFIYFKNKKDKEEFKQIKQFVGSSSDGKNSDQFKENLTQYNNNLNGFYSLSLKRPDKQKILLTPSSELLYKVDQTQRSANQTNGKKFANIMLMNQLSPDGTSFQSYSGLVRLSQQKSTSSLSNRTKVIEERVQMFPITMNGAPTVDSYVIRTNWNYAQTRNFYIIYWPLEYNLLEAKLKSIQEIPYTPNILHQIYVARVATKENPKLTFNLVNLNEDRAGVMPRKFCSSYDLFDYDKLFIFGGFYEKENNYLCLQSDITGFDLGHYNEQSKKCVVSNEKGAMYSCVNQGTKNKTTNSYIRTRRQYEFLQLSSVKDLSEQQAQIQNEQEKTVFILGGYGQNFVRPFSLNHCHYYEMKISIPTRSIKSVKKHTVYDKVMTANVKGMIKNRGSFRKFATYENKSLKPNMNIDSQYYLAHRSVYMLAEGKNQPVSGEEQMKQEEVSTNYGSLTLESKVKYFFATKLFGHFKKQYHTLAYRIGESIDKKNQPEEFLLSISSQGNHYLMVQKQNKLAYMRQLFLEVQVEDQQKGGRKVDTVALPHGSIISIDIRNKAIYAIVYHQVYTKGAYVLAECTLKSEQNEAIMTILHKFKNNMSQHSLFIPKINQLVLLHGITFEKTNINDYFISHKKDSGEVNNEVSLKQINYLPQTAYMSNCQTYFIKDENTESRNLQVESLTFIVPKRGKNNYSITCIANRLKLSFQDVKQNFYWEHQWNNNFTFEDVRNQQKICISKMEEMREGYHEDSSEAWNRKMIKGDSVEKMEDMKIEENEKNVMGTLAKNRIYIMKIISQNKKTYIGWLNGANQQQGKNGNEWKVPCYLDISGSANEIFRVWEKALPVQMHIKSLARYGDMNVSIPNAPLG